MEDVVAEEIFLDSEKRLLKGKEDLDVSHTKRNPEKRNWDDLQRKEWLRNRTANDKAFSLKL